MKTEDSILEKYNLNKGFFRDLCSCFTPVSLDDFEFLKKSDFKSIRSDWEEVGQYLQNAIDNFKV